MRGIKEGTIKIMVSKSAVGPKKCGGVWTMGGGVDDIILRPQKDLLRPSMLEEGVVGMEEDGAHEKQSTADDVACLWG